MGKVHISPSGRYELKVALSVKHDGYWQWTIGRVKDKRTEGYVSVVHRNYSAFPFCWVEDHADGHDYLLCGEDYQGQTVIQLDTGLRRDYLPPSAENGTGFCWVEIDYDDAELQVLGCYWGCPFETVIYDFSDPMSMPYRISARYYNEQDDIEEDEDDDSNA